MGGAPTQSCNCSQKSSMKYSSPSLLSCEALSSAPAWQPVLAECKSLKRRLALSGEMSNRAAITSKAATLRVCIARASLGPDLREHSSRIADGRRSASKDAAVAKSLVSLLAAATTSGHSLAKRRQNSSNRTGGDTSRTASRNSARDTAPERSSSQSLNSSKASGSCMPSRPNAAMNSTCDSSAFSLRGPASSLNANGTLECLASSRWRKSCSKTSLGMLASASKNSSMVKCPSLSTSMRANTWRACDASSPSSSAAFTNSPSFTALLLRPLMALMSNGLPCRNSM
mmetsp:Transcript_52495/g.122837  ORF Transcript_52495/g.122837 Transcript_52495/m.122837 type:complete len:286 (-) Transcript_52495:1075-1932(-)